MNTNNNQVVVFRSEFQKRLRLGNEAAIASLIYALVYVHQDATRYASDSNAIPPPGDMSKYVDQDATLPPPPFLLELIYHPIWGEYVYANPILLQSVVTRVKRGRLVNPDALVIWEKAATLRQTMRDGVEVSDLKKALCEYTEALKKGKIPQNGAQQEIIDAVVDFHMLLGELLKKDHLVDVPNQGEKQSYVLAASGLPGFAVALTWAADALGRKMEDAIDILKQRLSQSDNDQTDPNDGPTSGHTGGKSKPCMLERTLLETCVLHKWAQEPERNIV